MELRNKNKNSTRASFIARIPSLEGPICMTIMQGGSVGNGNVGGNGSGSSSDSGIGNNSGSGSSSGGGDKKLFVVTASGYLFR